MTTDKKSKRKYFTAADLIVIGLMAAVLLCSLFTLFGDETEDNLVAVVTVMGQVYCEIPLSQVEESYELVVEGQEKVVISVSSDCVEFISSGCSDKLCVNTGQLTRAGQSSVCLPARVSVKLVSDNAVIPDAVAG